MTGDRKADPFEMVAMLVAAVLPVAMLAAVVYGAAELRASRACLENGYPSARVDYALTAYCVKRVDQTDVVVPLHEVHR